MEKENNFDRAFPILSEIGYEILYCGKLGNASTLKVVTNYLASINLLSLGEALMVCKKYGLDLKTSYHGIYVLVLEIALFMKLNLKLF